MKFNKSNNLNYNKRIRLNDTINNKMNYYNPSLKCLKNKIKKDPNYIIKTRSDFKQKFPEIKYSLDDIEHIELEELLIKIYKNYPADINIDDFEEECLKEDIREIISHSDCPYIVVNYCTIFLARRIL
jgi:hypothetical protein